MYIMKMSPEFKDYLWGGDRLVTQYGKSTELRPVAESWEVSCYPGCSSVVGNGKMKGMTLSEVLRLHPEMRGSESGDFPVLIKLIDAKQELSLQVHPDDEYARRVENESGKNEMWYIMDCEADSELILGFKAPLERKIFEEAIRENTILDMVNRVKVKKGDCFSIPAGLLHAIGSGCLIAEIQQSSNVTYRVFDYGRTGADGKPRELHTEKAADVIDSNIKAGNSSGNESVRFDGYTQTQLTDWRYFSVKRLVIDGSAKLNRDSGSFACLLVTDGSLTAEHSGEKIELATGESAFVPAGLGDYSLTGKGAVLLTTV